MTRIAYFTHICCLHLPNFGLLVLFFTLLSTEKPNLVLQFYLKDEPFVRLKPDNLEFEGLCVDLLDAIAEPLQFQFEIYTLHDQTGRGRTHEEWQLALAQELQNGVFKTLDIKIAFQKLTLYIWYA